MGKAALEAPLWLGEPGHGVSPAFLALVRSEPIRELGLLDIGCGWGRLTLLLAPEAGRIVGIDRDAAALREARRLARKRSLANARFVVADAEVVEYRRWRPQMVVAHLCMSDAIIERASRALPPGGSLAFACFHTDQWKETGKVSRFAYSEERMSSVLRANGFVPERLEVEREVAEFSTVADGLSLVREIRSRWEADGRWENFLAFLEAGGRTLTRSHLIVKARKR
jgi:ubiquinone/menaquinone biosynthesis C-methylase UbiE